MSIWEHFLDFLRGRRQPRRSFRLDEGIARSIYDLALREKQPPDGIAQHLLSQAVQEHRAADCCLESWRGLTPREQQVVALICLNYSTSQIAVRLIISPETVKSHVHNAMFKFNVHSRKDLRLLLSNWDFTSWDEVL